MRIPLLIGTLLLPLSAFGQEAPTKVYGSDELAAFMEWLPNASTVTPPKLVAPFDQADKGVSVHYPKDWTTTVPKKTATQLSVGFSPISSLSRVEGSVSFSMIKKPAPLGPDYINKFFDQNAYLSTESESLGDWYIPGIGAMTEATDITIAGQPGKQFIYAANGGEVHIGVQRMFIIDSTIYTISMWAESKHVKSVYPVFDAMSKDLKVGAVQASSAKQGRAPASVSTTRIPKVQKATSSASSMKSARSTMSKAKSSVAKVRKTSAMSSKKASSAASAGTKSKAATKGDATFSFTEDWQTAWTLVDVEGMKESLKNATFNEEAGAQIPAYLHIGFPENSLERDEWALGGKSKTLGGTYAFVNPGTAGSQEMFMRFYVRFPEGFDSQREGSLAGILTGAARGEEQARQLGGALVYWEKGLLRMGFNADVTASGAEKFNEAAAKVPADGKWHRIDIRTNLQTDPKKFNGSAEAWLDGKKFLMMSDMKFQNRTGDLWDGFAIWASYDNKSTFTKATTTTWVDLADFSLSAKAFPDLKDIGKPMR